MSRALVFAGALIWALIISVLVLLVSVSQIIIWAVQQGYLTGFLFAYMLGFTTPVFLYIYFAARATEPETGFV